MGKVSGIKELMIRIRTSDAENMRLKNRITLLEGELEIETERRRKATNAKDRANEACDRAQSQMQDLNEKDTWKLIPCAPGYMPQIDGVRFLLGLPDDIGDKNGAQAAGYWSEQYQKWIWPYGYDHQPTRYKWLTKVK